MAAHGLKRARPAELIPGTVSVITARMNYLPAALPPRRANGRPWNSAAWSGPPRASCRSMRAAATTTRCCAAACKSSRAHLGARRTAGPPRLHRFGAGAGGRARGPQRPGLARQAHAGAEPRGRLHVLPGGNLCRPRPAAQRAGGAALRHLPGLHRRLPHTAIVAPHKLDARRCISYLTIEHAGPIPLELRPLIGNRIYGCDDCQLICPWNKFAQRSALPDFDERQGLTGQQLVTLFGWTEEEFLRFTEGSPIRRIGHERWLRNIAVAMGNALRVLDEAPGGRCAKPCRRAPRAACELVAEHVEWALAQ
jgi:epoxyqueuosine reductase